MRVGRAQSWENLHQQVKFQRPKKGQVCSQAMARVVETILLGNVSSLVPTEGPLEGVKGLTEAPAIGEMGPEVLHQKVTDRSSTQPSVPFLLLPPYGDGLKCGK